MNNIKPLFGIDITADKNNQTINGTEFVVRSVEKQKVDEYDAKQSSILETVEKSQTPLWIEIVKWLCLLIFLPVIVSLVKVGFTKAMQNAPILVIAGFVCGIAWVALQIYTKKREKNVLEEGKLEERVEEFDKHLEEMYKELDIPEDAQNVDILSFSYKIKKEKIVPHTANFQLTPYINSDVKIFSNDENIFVADMEDVYALKKSEFKSIIRVDKRISVPFWHKDEAPNNGKFKPYKMTLNSYGCVFFKPYYILILEHNGEEMGLYFPCYELEVFEHLTGLKAEVSVK